MSVALAADVLVLGGGPAGAWAAIEAEQSGASVILADKGRVGTSGATAAANTAVIDVPPGSAARAQVISRRLQRGLGLASADWVERMVDEAHLKLSLLEDWGYGFAVNENGRLHRGTLRGPDYMQLLRRRLLKLGVKLLDHSPALQLLMSDGAVSGARGLERRSGENWTARAGAVVVATGGCAFMSKALGTYGLTGDGLLMGAEAGATLSGMEFSGQYGISHAAATVTKNLIYDWATFSDASGRRLEGDDIFDIVARALPNGPVHAIIDKASPYIQEGLRRGQPNILLALDRQGIDPFRERFPVTLRYEGTVRGVGGLRIDANGATSVPGLFAAGDAASRESVVGAVSGGGGPNSTWAIATGCWAGRSAARFAAELGPGWRERTTWPGGDAEFCAGEGMPDEDATEGIEVVQRQVFPLDHSYARDAPTILASLGRLDEAWAHVCAPRRPSGAPRARLRGRETVAMLATARWIASAALARRETRGVHRRTDFPTLDPRAPARLEVTGLDQVSVQAHGPAS